MHVTPDGGGRDYREMLLVQEVFRQHKPLLAICRGQQLLNVALGARFSPTFRPRRPQPSIIGGWINEAKWFMKCN